MEVTPEVTSTPDDHTVPATIKIVNAITTTTTDANDGQLQVHVPSTPSRRATPRAMLLGMSPASKAIANAVKATLTPPADEYTKKALSNTKNTFQLKRNQGEILNSEAGVSALKAKKDLKNAKEEEKLRKAEARRIKAELKAEKADLKRKRINGDDISDCSHPPKIGKRRMRVEDVYSDCSDDGDDSEMPVSEDEEPLQVHREYIKSDVVIAYCIGSYYLRKVCSESGLLAVVKIMAEVPEDKEKISVQHYKSVACTYVHPS